MTPERFQRITSILNQRQPDLTVITDYVHKGRNLSAIVRTADAVGVSDVHCVIGDKDYRSFRGTALGSHRWVNVERYRQINEPVNALKAQGFQVVVAHLSSEAVDFHDIDYTKPTAILMGAEKEGVSNEAAELADAHITIPMVGMVESYNVSVAAGIILTEAQRQRQQAGMYDQRRIDQVTFDKLFFEWAHPKLTQFCKYHHLPYPPLREDGELVDPSGWYAQAKVSIERWRQYQGKQQDVANG